MTRPIPTGLMLGAKFMDLLGERIYKGGDDPCAWPLKATEEDLKGLPPHVYVQPFLLFSQTLSLLYIYLGRRRRAYASPVPNEYIDQSTNLSAA